MATQDKTNENLLELAKKAADQFASGNIIGGVGIAGLFLLLSASTVTTMVASPQMLGAAGILLIVFSGLLYLQKIKIKQETLMVLAKGYFEIAAGLTQKINNNTVAAADVEKLATTIFQKLLEEK